MLTILAISVAKKEKFSQIWGQSGLYRKHKARQSYKVKPYFKKDKGKEKEKCEVWLQLNWRSTCLTHRKLWPS